jgi:hypothetical protein
MWLGLPDFCLIVWLCMKQTLLKYSRVPEVLVRRLDEVQTPSDSTTLLCDRIIPIDTRDVGLAVVIRDDLVVVVSIDRQECEAWIQWRDCLWPTSILTKTIILGTSSANMIPLRDRKFGLQSYCDSDLIIGNCRFDRNDLASEIFCVIVSQVDDCLWRYFLQRFHETSAFPHTAGTPVLSTR